MYVNGKIPINSEPSYSEILDIATKSSISAINEENSIKLITKEFFFFKETSISIYTTKNSVNYRCFISELSAYCFLCAVALFFLYGMLSVKAWSLLLICTAATILIVKVFIDKRIRNIVETIIPLSARIIPEMAGKEHVEWLNNPLVCSACGSTINKYSKKCLSCGITLFNKVDKISDINHTGEKNTEIKYFYTE